MERVWVEKCSRECTVSPYSTVKCNCILHTPFILPLWPWDLAYLARSACGLYNRMDTFFRCSPPISQHIPRSPSNHNISCFFLSYIHTISYIHISLYYLLYLFFLYSTISCILPRPFTPHPFILCVLRCTGTISCLHPISCGRFWIPTISWIHLQAV